MGCRIEEHKQKQANRWITLVSQVIGLIGGEGLGCPLPINLQLIGVQEIHEEREEMKCFTGSKMVYKYKVVFQS